MTSLRLVAGVAIALAGCYIQQPSPPQYPEPMQYSGPPGGQMDPSGAPNEAQYEQDSQPPEQQDVPQAYQAVPQAYSDGAEQGMAPGEDGEPVPSADPQDPGYAMGPVTDGEIDATLGDYGQWSEDPDYGRVWRPDATVVGVDFTPYESCGTWEWTDWGWSFNCDWDWGWLPFHYGRWAWMDDGDYWGWVPGYQWGPAWVDWRNGGGYVGWRPTAPEIRDHRGQHGPTFHDHRGQHQGPTFHDHRTGSHDSQWRFVSANDFGKGHIRPHLYKDLAEGLRVTAPVMRPPLRGTTPPIHVASTMAARLTNPVWRQQHAAAGGWRKPVTVHQPGPRQVPRWGVQQQVTVPHQTWRQPTQAWRQPGAWQQSQQGWRQPPRAQTWSPPQTQHPVWTRPASPAYGATRPTYGGGSTWTRPTYSPPSRPSYAPSRPSYAAPSRPTYTAPTYSPPSRPSYSPPSRSWSAPSAPSHYSGGGGGRSFGGGHSFGGGGGRSFGGGHSFGGGGHSFGGGGGRRR